MGSSIGADEVGIYGVLGKPSLDNIPGARFDAATWTDQQGNFWLFGGYGSDGKSYDPVGLSDLWELNPTTREWTWMGGSDVGFQRGNPGLRGLSSKVGTPENRSSATFWTDKEGNFWLYGGVAQLICTTMDGPYQSCNYVLDDLWRYRPSTHEWEWVSGSQDWTGAVYGTKRISAPKNTPGVRESSIGWVDQEGKLWLFGGSPQNDLWTFDPIKSEWAWMAGSSKADQSGIYGELGTPSPTTTPGTRGGAMGWTDSDGRFWLFGGIGNGTSRFWGGLLSDLWRWDPGTLEWTWMAGSGTIPVVSTNPAGSPGIYGTLGRPAPGNNPGSRHDAATWIDDEGNLWMFGGEGYDSTSRGGGWLNDLWVFRPKPASTKARSAASQSDQR